MPILSQNTKIIRTKDQISCNLHGESAILNMKNGIYYGLNPVASRVWNLLAQPMMLEELCSTVEIEYEVSPEQLQADVHALVEDLLAQQLVEIWNEEAH